MVVVETGSVEHFRVVQHRLVEAEIVASQRVVVVVAVWNVLQVRIVDDVRLLREANVIVVVVVAIE